jgi:hypothetical protein
LARETEALGENLLQRHFVHHKPHMTILRLEPGPPRWEAWTFLLYGYPYSAMRSNRHRRYVDVTDFSWVSIECSGITPQIAPVVILHITRLRISFPFLCIFACTPDFIA